MRQGWSRRLPEKVGARAIGGSHLRVLLKRRFSLGAGLGEPQGRQARARVTPRLGVVGLWLTSTIRVS